ncbi:MAG: redox-sensing transcriptional repressor Rex [Phycisphaeraceae bacterium]|nr:redox-sensing transcriptional repressor Rex [Phycisphaeraceae bacterium]
MCKKLSVPTITRLCMVFQQCDELLPQGVARISSSQMGKKIGVPAHTIRKDINCLGEVGDTGSGYDVARLKRHLERALGFEKSQKACVVGLGRLGSALMDYEKFQASGFSVVAGFDSSVNRIETIKTQVPVYPAYEMEDVIRREAIEMALLAVPAHVAQATADVLVSCGIRGIVNFAPVVIEVPASQVQVRHMNVINEMRVLSSLMTLGD